MTGQMALRKLRKELRKYNAVFIGDEGIREAYYKFLEGYGIKPLKPTKGQLENYTIIGKLLHPPTITTGTGNIT